MKKLVLTFIATLMGRFLPGPNQQRGSFFEMKTIIQLIFLIVMLVGEVKCLIKMINCNWEPIGKAEIIYTIGTFTGAGCIIGYINIQDK